MVRKINNPEPERRKKFVNESFETVIEFIIEEFKTFYGQIEIDGKIFVDGYVKQNYQFVGFNAKTYKKNMYNLSDKSDPVDWYFTGDVIYRQDNFKPIRRSKEGRGTHLLFKINEYIGDNCYIPSDGICFIKCVNFLLKRDMTEEFNKFIYSFSKHNRKGIMTCARIKGTIHSFNITILVIDVYVPKRFNKKIDMTGCCIYTKNISV